MPPAAGAQLDGFEILRPLGAGGMGEVYLARDRELNRTVAIKVLPADVTADANSVARFEQEARAASALNHPNVCVIYALGRTAEGGRYIAMEHIDGETLDERLARGRLEVAAAVDIAIQIASALSAAHAAGIVHRDIKPANVMIRQDRLVKVLDFGLAKLLQSGVTLPADGSTHLDITERGSLVGTIAYMSPEQARGSAVDARTDVWALGVVLYEMVTGRPPFTGATRSDLLVAILDREPTPIGQLEPTIRAELQRIVRKLLRKDPEDRYQAVKDALLDLKAFREQLASDGPNWRPGSIGRSVAAHKLATITAVAVLVVALGLAAWWTSRTARAPEDGSARASPVGVPYRSTRLTAGPGLQTDPAFSPDGRFIAYASNQSGNFDIWVQSLTGHSDPIQVTKSLMQETQPAWSPDNHMIVFRSESGGGGLHVVPALGGAERRLTEFGEQPRWSRDGLEILFLEGAPVNVTGGLIRAHVVPFDGGEPREVLADFLRGGYWVWLGLHPDGRVSVLGTHRARGFGFFTVSLENETVVTSRRVSLEGADEGIIRRFQWDAAGNGLYLEATMNAVRSLWRVRVDPTTLDWKTAERLTSTGATDVAVTASGDGSRIAFSNQTESSRLWVFPLDAGGRRLGPGKPLTPQGALADFAALSPDGRRVAYTLSHPGVKRREMWVTPLEGGPPELLAPNADAGCWSPDGTKLTYIYWNVKGDDQTVETRHAIRQLGGIEQFVSPWTSEFLLVPTDWTPDGRFLIATYKRPFSSGIGQVVLWPTDNASAVAPERVLLTAPDSESYQARLSPNGRWLSFVTWEASSPGRMNINIAPAQGAPRSAWVPVAASHTWADKPRWSADGKLLYFTSRHSSSFFNLWATRFDSSRGVPIGEPFAVTTFDSPNLMISPYIDRNDLGVSARHVVLPMLNVTGSIWMLEGMRP